VMGNKWLDKTKGDSAEVNGNCLVNGSNVTLEELKPANNIRKDTRVRIVETQTSET